MLVDPAQVKSNLAHMFEWFSIQAPEVFYNFKTINDAVALYHFHLSHPELDREFEWWAPEAFHAAIGYDPLLPIRETPK